MPSLRRSVVRLAPVAVLFLVGLAAGVAPAACSSNTANPEVANHEGGTPDGGAQSDGGGSGAVARFLLGGGTTPPNFLDVPFPTDAYLSNGSVLAAIPGLGGQIPNSTSFINYGLSQLNGFSRVALAIFAVEVPDGDAGNYTFESARIDPTTLPVAETDCTANTSSVYVVDLAPAAGASPLLPCRAAFHDDQPHSSGTDAVIAVGPPRGYLLQPAHQYAVVLTSRVKDTGGNPLAASSDFTTVVNGTAAGPIGATYMKAYTTASASLKTALSTDGATIVSMAAFTTMNKTPEIFAMRNALESAPAATLSWDSATMAPMGATKFAAVATAGDAGASDAGDGGTGNGTLPAGFTASLDDWLGVVPPSGKLPNGTDNPDVEQPVRAHDQLAAVGTAVFSATSYLQTTGNSYGNQAFATFAIDGGVPVPQANVKIWITFAIPTAPMPAAGYPAIIVQHGLSGSREFVMDLANVFAAQGWLVAAIDSVTFGARAPEAANTVDAVNDFAGPGSTYKGPDGFADTENGSTDFFGGLQNILAICDQFREGGFDTAQVVKLLRSNPDLSPLATGSGTPQIDPSHIAYIGDSLGAMEGTIAAAIEPHVQAWFLNVNSGSLMPELAAHSPSISPLLSEAAAFNFQITGDVFNWSHPLIQVLQNIIEPGDPISYAQYLTTSPQPLAGTATTARNAAMTEVIWDGIVTDEGSEAISRAAGWGHALPNVGSNAEIQTVAEATNNPRATPFVNVSPDDAGAFHDTPVTGSTAIVFQVGPGQHGVDLVDSIGEYDFQIPYDGPPYTKLATPVTFPESYAAVQSVALTFFGDAFQGRVPRVLGPNAVGGFAVPIRDELDGGP
ncbi:MAG: hypothetical protein ACLQVI_42765 [Polyangiaceae bacterium]